jgi:uncharacterized protein (TIGR03000 family)
MTNYSPAFSPALRSVILNVRVPNEAKVFVNGMATTSTGSDRRFVSNGLEPGFSYTYELRAEVERDGRMVTETKEIKVVAGQSVELAFAFTGNEKEDRVAREPVRTSLILHVPADAKVYLSGNETQSAGVVREFTTTKLDSGDQWADYTVRVEVERNGLTLTRDERVSLRGGESRDLSVDFDAPQVARAETDQGR